MQWAIKTWSYFAWSTPETNSGSFYCSSRKGLCVRGVRWDPCQASALLGRAQFVRFMALAGAFHSFLQLTRILPPPVAPGLTYLAAGYWGRCWQNHGRASREALATRTPGLCQLIPKNKNPLALYVSAGDLGALLLHEQCQPIEQHLRRTQLAGEEGKKSSEFQPQGGLGACSVRPCPALIYSVFKLTWERCPLPATR